MMKAWSARAVWRFERPGEEVSLFSEAGVSMDKALLPGFEVGFELILSEVLDPER